MNQLDDLLARLKSKSATDSFHASGSKMQRRIVDLLRNASELLSFWARRECSYKLHTVWRLARLKDTFWAEKCS